MSTDHIKIPDIQPVVRYVADGTTVNYAYPFPIFASEDLAIHLGGAKQSAGFTINGAGLTVGGSVVFDTAPASGTLIRLERDLPLERLTDFLEGGDFSAKAINTELDFLIATVQQVQTGQARMLRYAESEGDSAVSLPAKTDRAGKVLGFDSGGNPVAVSAAGTMASPDFTASGTGGVTRTASSKLSDVISAKDFGAVGDGLTNDTLAIQQALTAYQHVYIPEGTYLISSPLTVGLKQSLFGAGQSSIIKTLNNNFTAIEMTNEQGTLHDLKIEGGREGLKIFGRDGAAVQNNVTNVTIIGAATGVLLDGYTNTAKPCYWNSLTNVLIEQPTTDGVRLTLSGAGDTPNSNKFYNVRVFSKGINTTGCGFYIEDGKLNNAFTSCEVDLASTGDACFRVGAGVKETLIVNLLTEAPSGSLISNLKLDSGSQDTSVYNLTANSDGAAIEDNSGGNFNAYNAGFPEKNRLRKTRVTDLSATLMRYDTEFIDGTGTINLDLSHSVHIVDATNGAMTLMLPAASAATNAQVIIKKKDATSNVVTIDETGSGSGPDRKQLQLGGQGDYAILLSNGAEWFILASNRIAGHTRFIDSSGIIDIDMTVNVYILSSFNGAMTARLPPANADKANGRTITLKKTDVSSNNITVTEQGGNGPDQTSHVLSSQYSTITVTSDGGQWYVVSKYP